MKSPVPVRPLVLALTACWPLSPALAAESDAETIVVTATRTAISQHRAAASISRVSAEDFAARQANSIGEVLQDLPNVDFGGGPRAAGKVPTIRGFSGRQIALLVDGVRLNDASGLSSPLYIDPFFLDSAEVLRGAGSSLYGNGGLGGVLALKTLSARDLLRPEENTGAQIRSAVDSSDLSKRLQTRLYGRSGAIDGLVALSLADWDRVRQGDGRSLRPNDGRSANGLFKLGYQADAKTRLEFNHRAYHERALRPNNPQADVALGGAGQVPVQHNVARQRQTSVNASRADDGDVSGFSTGLYQTRLDLHAEANPDFQLPRTASFTETLGGHLQQILRFEEGGRRHRLSYGLDAYRDRQSADSDGQPNPVVPVGRQSVVGVFIQDEIDLTPQLQLIPSLRQDRYQTESGNARDRHDHLSPKLTLAVSPARDLRLYASYAESYRAPSLSESRMSLQGTSYLFNFAPNPDLKPETDRSLETGFSYRRRDGLFAGDRLRLQGSLFSSKVEDLIATAVVGRYQRTGPFSGTGLVFQSRNETRAKRHGVELEGAYGLGAWQVDIAYSRLRSRNRISGDALFAPPDKLALGLGWRGTRFDLNWRARLVAAQDYDATVARRTAGYGVHDLSLSWHVDGKTPLRLDVGVGNLFDKAYVVYQSANPSARTLEAGRSGKVALTATF